MNSCIWRSISCAKFEKKKKEQYTLLKGITLSDPERFYD